MERRDRALLGDDGRFVYGADSGTGAFMDAAAWREYDARMERGPEDYADALIKRMEETYIHTRPGC